MANYEILKTSARGAKLVTDGKMVCWLMGRFVREDGSLTPCGLVDFSNATKTLDEYRTEESVRAVKNAMFEAKRAMDREAFIKAQAELREMEKRPYDVIFDKSAIVGETDKAYKIWAGRTQVLYGKVCKAYEYLPKSMVSIEYDGDRAKATMPVWLFKQKSWLNDISR